MRDKYCIIGLHDTVPQTDTALDYLIVGVVFSAGG